LDFSLPLRMAGASAERVVGFPFRRLAAEEGVVFPDHFVLCPVGARRRIERVLFDLRPGVTEVYLHPGLDTDELRAACTDWAGRVEDHAFLCSDPSLPDLIGRAGATLVGYRELRELQRAA
jgi:chitin disaccharide deacetylase